MPVSTDEHGSIREDGIHNDRQDSQSLSHYSTANSHNYGYRPPTVPDEERGITEITTSVPAQQQTSAQPISTIPHEEQGITEITSSLPTPQRTVPVVSDPLAFADSPAIRPPHPETPVPTDSLPPYRPTTSPSPQTLRVPRDEKLPSPSLLLTLIYLSLFSITGTAARLGLILLTDYPSPPCPPLVWAQFTGCFIMGLCQSLLPIFTARDAPIFIGLTTGLAGSLTSFSSLILDTFLQTSYSPLLPPGHLRSHTGQGFLAATAYLILTLCLSFSALRLGRNLGRAVHAQVGIQKMSTVVISALDKTATCLAVLVFPLALFLGIFSTTTNRRILWGMVFSPPGCIARYFLSRLLNPRLKLFPLGTFTVNILGTGILAGAIVGGMVLDERGEEGGGVWLGALQDGFCGTLTTVSTFVVEAEGMRMRRAGGYVGGSLAVGMGVMVGVLGGWVWSRG